ncbi:MAG: alcohol dehydrogenase catalytic domain-containing protein [Synergistaceae bacterium]|nr:alcohol dehydrogenase catalytic domain-containing protein [Synergistaceae bacterium]
MRTAVVTEPFKVEIEDRPVPKAGSHDVLIKVERAGICGSDLHLYKGTHAFRKLPCELGHEVSGMVCETGSNVARVAIGDRVTVEPQVGCGDCEYCESGNVNLCVGKTVPGTPAWGGTFAEYFRAPEQTIYKLASDVSYDSGVLAEPLAVAVQAMNKRANGESGSMAILGCGTIGLLVLAVARHRGIEDIYCTDTAQFNRQMAIKLGAKAAFDPLSCDAADMIKAANSGHGVDTCVVTASARNIIDQASSVTKKLGEVILVSMITEPIPVYTYGFVFNERKLIGAMTYTTGAFAEACELINGGLDVESIVTHRISLEESGEGLEILDKKKEDAGKILICP